MSPLLRRWIEETIRRRCEDLPRRPFTPGLVDPQSLDPAAARRAAAVAIVGLIADRLVVVGFRRGESFAVLESRAVNIDGALVEPPTLASVDFHELLFGVGAHEAAHIRYSCILRRPSAIRLWLQNVIEDERIEVAIARGWPPLASPLATTRAELIKSDPALHGFLGALFYLVRAPARMPLLLWMLHRRRLERAIRILTPFPESAADASRAVRRLMRLVRSDERRTLPRLPSFDLSGGSGRRRRRGDLRLGLRSRHAVEEDAWSGETPKAVWSDADGDAAGYTAACIAARADAHVFREALTTALRPRWRPMAPTGRIDRRRLHAWPFDDRIFRVAEPEPCRLTIVLILDLSGSMRSWWNELQRVAVAFSEAAHGLRHVRLHVYGHAADGGGEPQTEITRFATPARGRVLGLGSLPLGANNRDGHALELVASDLLVREASRRAARIAIHLCDNEPAACDYGGAPARRATRLAMAAFTRSFGPLLTLVFGGHEKAAGEDPMVVRWRAEGGIRDLANAIARHLGGAGQAPPGP
jgi:hypothetical protein